MVWKDEHMIHTLAAAYAELAISIPRFNMLRKRWL
jgi:hypothetical protein